MKVAVIFVCNGSVFELLLSSDFIFETLQAPRKLPNATERLHNILVSFDKIPYTSIKDLLAPLSITSMCMMKSTFYSKSNRDH